MARDGWCEASPRVFKHCCEPGECPGGADAACDSKPSVASSERVRSAAQPLISAGSALSRWVWLNALLDARNEEYRAALPEVLKAVTEFVRRVLAAHPLYARRR